MISMNKFKKGKVVSSVRPKPPKPINLPSNKPKPREYSERITIKASGNYCYVCGKYFSNKPFENMNAAGESTIGRIELFDEGHILCRDCTRALYSWVRKRQEELKKNEEGTCVNG